MAIINWLGLVTTQQCDFVRYFGQVPMSCVSLLCTGADGGGMAWPAPERRRVFKLVEVSEDIVGKTKIFAVSQNTAKKSH